MPRKSKIVIDPDHKPLGPEPLAEEEGNSGAWSQFSQWAGVDWFHEDAKSKFPRAKVKSKFPIVIEESRYGKPNPEPKSRNGTSPKD
jgi:hypothetical protein